MQDIFSAHKIYDLLEFKVLGLIQKISHDNIGSSWYGIDTLTGSFVICAVFIAYSFLWSILGNNCSKVDQIWSVTPVVYSWFYYFHDGTYNPRVLLGCILVSVWGIRLTYNFWRRGGYGNFITHEEDYRWPIIRNWMNNSILFFIFNLTFIATYQNLLLWFITLPIYELSKSSHRIVSFTDIILAILFLFLLIMESMADQQQWNFQTYKYSLSEIDRKRNTNTDIRNGFLTNGLFTYTRHPNYFAEQSMWVVIYLFPALSTDGFWLDWTVIGIAQLILLFIGSMAFSESITASKYPAYKAYQRRVSQCFPLPFFFTNADSIDKKEK